jgi:hypothetical protein
MGFPVKNDDSQSHRGSGRLNNSFSPEQILFIKQLFNQSQPDSSETKERIDALIDVGMVEAINSLKDIASNGKNDESKICASTVLLNLYQSHKCD